MEGYLISLSFLGVRIYLSLSDFYPIGRNQEVRAGIGLVQLMDGPPMTPNVAATPALGT